MTDEPCTATYVFGGHAIVCVLEAGHRDGHYSDDLTFPVSWTTPVMSGVGQ